MLTKMYKFRLKKQWIKLSISMTEMSFYTSDPFIILLSVDLFIVFNEMY